MNEFVIISKGLPHLPNRIVFHLYLDLNYTMQS